MNEDRKPGELEENWNSLSTPTKIQILSKELNYEAARRAAEMQWGVLPAHVKELFASAWKGYKPTPAQGSDELALRRIREMAMGLRPIHVARPELLKKNECYICGHAKKWHGKGVDYCRYEHKDKEGTYECGVGKHKFMTWADAQKQGYGNPPRRMHLLKKDAVRQAEELKKNGLQTPEDRDLLTARKMGHAAGTNRAAWVAQDLLGGRAPGDVRERAKILLKQYEDGDPALMDRFRVPNLSGEYADEYSEQDLAADFDLDPEDEADKIFLQELVSEWNEAASEGFWDTLMRAVNRTLEISEENPHRKRPFGRKRIYASKAERHKCPQTERCAECSQPMCEDCSCKGVGRPDVCLICYGGYQGNPQGGLTVIGERTILVQTSGGSVTRGMGRVLGKQDGSIFIEGTFTGPRSALQRFVNGKLEAIAYYDVRKAKAEGKPNPRLPWKHDFSTEQVSMTITKQGLHIKGDRPLWGIQ